MAALLEALGFTAMAKDVLTETDPDRLRRYARIIIKQSPKDKQHVLATKFYALNVI
jgi:hypothetical protein